MDYYASGDTRKMSQSSDDDEGYENRPPYAASARSLNQSNVRDKPRFMLESSEKTFSTPMPSISDDTDRPFWGEDESSGSESTLQLNKKQKRRYTLSHRNRISVHRSRSSLFQSSSSSLNSMSEQISTKVYKQERYNRLASRTKVKQIKRSGCKIIKRKIWTKKRNSSFP